MKRYMDRYERAAAAVKRFFDTHTAAEVVAYVKKIAPYAAASRQRRTLRGAGER